MRGQTDVADRQSQRAGDNRRGEFRPAWRAHGGAAAHGSVRDNDTRIYRGLRRRRAARRRDRQGHPRLFLKLPDRPHRDALRRRRGRGAAAFPGPVAADRA